MRQRIRYWAFNLCCFLISLPLFLLGIETGAKAQSVSPLAGWQYSAGQVLAPLGEDLPPDAPKWRVILGPSVIYQPEYEGSDNYRIQPGAVISIRYKERFYISTGEGLGYDIVRGRDYRAGASVHFHRGRNDDVDGLYRMGGIDPALHIRIYGEYVLRPVVFSREFPIVTSFEARRAVTSYDGLNATAGLYFPVAGSRKDKWFVFSGGSITYAGAKSVETFFNVNPVQAAATGYPVYDADAGFASMSAGLTAGWFVTDHILFNGNVGAKRLMKDVRESPIVQERWQFLFSLSLGYMF